MLIYSLIFIFTTTPGFYTRDLVTSFDELELANMIAVRKLKELSRETNQNVVNMIPEFLNRTRFKASPLEESGCVNWLTAMNDAVWRDSNFLGIGGQVKKLGSFC